MPALEVMVLGSGSAGNALAIRCAEEVLLVDAGFSARELTRRLEAASIAPETVRGVLISHEHSDHIKGLRVFCKRHGNIPAYANSLTAEFMRVGNHAPERLFVFSNGSPFIVGGFDVEAFSVSHDASDPVGFLVAAGERRIGIATDFGHAGKMVPWKLHDSDVLVLESNHDPELLRQSGRPAMLQQRILGRRGHLSNQGAADLLPHVIGPRTRHLVMAHLSRDCNRPELVQQSISARLAELGCADTVSLRIADQDAGCPVLSLP